MISKKKLAAGVAGVATLFAIAGTTLSAVSASAVSQGACVVRGTANNITGETNNVPRTPGATGGSFSGVTITCVPPAPVSDIGGSWTNVSASFGSSSEDCAAGDGSGNFTGGSGPAGNITGGAFTYSRAGTVVTVDGAITAGSVSRSFKAVLNFTPTSGPCLPGGSGLTNANLDGTAVIL